MLSGLYRYTFSFHYFSIYYLSESVYWRFIINLPDVPSFSTSSFLFSFYQEYKMNRKMWNLVRSCCRLVQSFYFVYNLIEISHECCVYQFKNNGIYNEYLQYISFMQQRRTHIPLLLTRAITINYFLIVILKKFKMKL